MFLKEIPPDSKLYTNPPQQFQPKMLVTLKVSEYLNSGHSWVIALGVFFSQTSIVIDPEICDIFQIAPDEMAKLAMKACA